MPREIAVDTVIIVFPLGIAEGKLPRLRANPAGLPITAAATVLGTLRLGVAR